MVQPILAPTRPDWDKPNVPTPAEWEKVKEIFTKYYLNIDNTYGQLTLNEIRKIMAENHQFNANEAQYKNKISKWKLGRNLDKNTVKNLARIQDKRAQSGGEKTAFKFHGIPVSEDKLERSRKRLGLAQPVATDPELSVTPPTISYSTPTLQSDFTMDDVSAEVDVPGVNGITVAINDIATGIHEISAATHEISAAINEIAAAANDELFNSNSVDIDGLDEKISSEIIFVEEPIMFSNDPIITSDPINMDIICIDSEKEHFSVFVEFPWRTASYEF
ncbi:uncharacterized protein H6S33_004620 [Morchella sextelata]|uniref:uncharacterized protein n=1 Tax=Morchella sextelata TaxID=1174677 RepID=UPI001D0419B9|nr:uncharacterized protein H6S33_004620 [Morchella sextelata]KAH0605398.1 hypothetical protein H6S33_004620 [Morchella sextelata]